jgi:hypothetical protein
MRRLTLTPRGTPTPLGHFLSAAVRVQHDAQRSEGIAMWSVVDFHPATVRLNESRATKLGQMVAHG